MKSQPIQPNTNYNHPPKTHRKRNMVTSFIICGSGSIPREEEEEHQNHHERTTQSAGSSPRRSSSRRSRIHHHHKNPYATRGLDKFTALLAEIEEKKQMIYSENNPDEICFVQFDYSKDNNCKPVVIKVKPNNYHKAEINQTHKQEKQNHDPDVVAATSTARTDHHDKSEALDHAPVQENNKNKSLLRRLQLQKLRKPSCYLPAMVILILIFLAFFGRSVAILCTSIGWYVIPTISKRNLDSRKSFKKKGLVGHQGRG